MQSFLFLLAFVPVCTLSAGFPSHPHQRRDDVGNLISVDGDHAFIAPGDDDRRGPCPVLNALANHGYISRNGITTFDEVVAASQKVFGMEEAFAATLAARAVAFAGNPDTEVFSIGGAPPPAAEDADLLKYPAAGLSGTNDVFESDASLLMGDWYTYHGDNYNVQTNLFKELMNTAGFVYTFPLDFVDNTIYKKLRLLRLQNSKEQNPEFWWGPNSILIGELGTYLIPLVFSNHTAEYPNGTLPLEVIQSFYGVVDQGENGEHDLVAVPGNERIPENWYAAPTGSIQLSGFIEDVASLIANSPETGTMGGNTGYEDTFTAIDIVQLTGGVYNLTTLGTVAGLTCFVSESTRWLSPGVLDRLFTNTTKAMDLLTTYVLSPPDSGCAVIETFDTSVFDIYPGIKKNQFL